MIQVGSMEWKMDSKAQPWREREQIKSGEVKPCGCPIEAECDHAFSGFRDFCKYNPDAPECKIFDL